MIFHLLLLPYPTKMQKHISWDPSLVRKYGSSNHLKLLNQLRNEVTKYPLNKKKDLALKDKTNNSQYKNSQYSSISQSLTSSESNSSNDKNINQNLGTIYKSNHNSYTNDIKIKSIKEAECEDLISLDSTTNNKNESPTSNISFNNTKNFNIHKNNISSDPVNSKDNKLNDKMNESLSFNDRLNRIDMK